LLKKEINQQDLNIRKIRLSIKKPIFLKNRQATKEIEMITESIPQLMLQIYIFQKKNYFFNFFSSSVEVDELYLSQIRSIITSMFSIIFGLISNYGGKAFFYYDQKIVLLDEIRYPKKDYYQAIGRFISLIFWYFSVVISRLVLIALIISYELYLLIPFIIFILIKLVVLSMLEKKYFEKTKFIKEFQKETAAFENLCNVNIENFIYYKPKSKLRLVLTVFYMIFGVYENIFINIEHHSDIFYIPRHTNNYIIYYTLFYIQNIIFSIILYFGFNNNIITIVFYDLTFPVSVLIQILYRWFPKKAIVSFSVLN
jgi:hypothetical protein